MNLRTLATQAVSRNARQPNSIACQSNMLHPSRFLVAALTGLPFAGAAFAQTAAPACSGFGLSRVSQAHDQSAIAYTVSFPDLGAHTAAVAARVPTDGKQSLELMMAIWSPGYYKVENYADRVSALVARTPSGDSLAVERVARNRWRVATKGAAEIMLTYRVVAGQRSVTTDWVGDSLIVLNGAPTFITIADTVHRPAEIKLDLPTGWRSATSLDTVPDRERDHYRAADYDELVDSPIIAGGNLRLRRFTVGASQHTIADAGDIDGWDSDRAAQDIARFVEEDRRFWG